MVDVVAHRGVHESARENTLAAFRAALELGVDGVELDVRRTLDGSLVIHHDPSVDGLVIARTKADDLPAYIPRLDEALTLLRGLQVNVEIKNLKGPREPHYDESGTFPRSVSDCIREMHLIESVSISSFDRATCEQVRAHDSSIGVAWLVAHGSLPRVLRSAAQRRFNAVNPFFTMLTPKSQRLASELGLSLNVWTVNEGADLLAMADLGVASVITDQPALALDLFSRSS